VGTVPAIRGVRPTLTAVALVAGGLGALLSGAQTGGGTSGLTAAEAAEPTARAAARLPVTRASDLLDSNRLRLRLRAPRRSRADVTARLALERGGAVRLAGRRRVTLPGRSWRKLSLRLAPQARSELARCAAGTVVLRVGDRRAASRPLQPDSPGCGGPFAAGSIWNSELPADAPVDPASHKVVADLLRKVEAGHRGGTPPTINTTSYAPPIYTVPAGQPRVRVRLDASSHHAEELADAFASVPLPDDARPAPGTDSELVVWQPSSDTLWEFWRLRRDHGGWTAHWGGRIEGVSQSPGYYGEPHPDWGATASSLSIAGGVITPRDLESGAIEHALAIGVPSPRTGEYALPAQRTDGDSRCRHSVPEGARLRLDPSLNVDELGLPPVVAMIARAAQRYGIYVRDSSDSVSFYAQSTVSLESDPYPESFGGSPPWELLEGFPWSRLQVVQMDLRRMPGSTLPLLATGLLNGC
jgi:hypothetical protein